MSLHALGYYLTFYLKKTFDKKESVYIKKVPIMCVKNDISL